jgi:hypothetical protein
MIFLFFFFYFLGSCASSTPPLPDEPIFAQIELLNNDPKHHCWILQFGERTEVILEESFSGS